MPRSGGALTSMEPSQMHVTTSLVVDLDTCSHIAHSSSGADCACATLWTLSVVMQVTTQARSIVTTVRLQI